MVGFSFERRFRINTLPERLLTAKKLSGDKVCYLRVEKGGVPKMQGGGCARDLNRQDSSRFNEWTETCR
jgi:hypothetical protein